MGRPWAVPDEACSFHVQLPLLWFFFSETPLGISCKQVLCQALRVEFLTTLWFFPSENILVIFERASLNCWIENYCKWVLHFCISLVSWKEVALLTNQKQAIMWIHLLGYLEVQQGSSLVSGWEWLAVLLLSLNWPNPGTLGASKFHWLEWWLMINQKKHSVFS